MGKSIRQTHKVLVEWWLVMQGPWGLNGRDISGEIETTTKLRKTKKNNCKNDSNNNSKTNENNNNNKNDNNNNNKKIINNNNSIYVFFLFVFKENLLFEFVVPRLAPPNPCWPNPAFLTPADLPYPLI